MESPSKNLRISGRKAKKKTFDDYISNATWSVTAGKYKSSETGFESKVLKQDKCRTADEVIHSNHSVISSCANNDNSLVKASNSTEAFGITCANLKNDEKTSKKDEVFKAPNSQNALVTKKLSKRSENECGQSVKTPAQKHSRVKKQEKSIKKKLRHQMSKRPQTHGLSQASALSFELHQKQLSTEDYEKNSCKKSGCGKKGLTCCIKATDSCMESTGKTSRWYHMSMEEHYCNGCFEQFYRSKNSDCNKLHEWKRLWCQNSRADSNFKILSNYIAERQLPFWVQCTLCGHWRSLTNDIELTPNIVATYTCNMGNLADQALQQSQENEQFLHRVPHVKYSCSAPNDPGVEEALNPASKWMSLLKYVPFLKNSPAAPFLTGYYPDGVGMSAVDTNFTPQLSDFSCDSDGNDVMKSIEVLERIKAKPIPCESPEEVLSDTSQHLSRMTSPGRRKRSCKEAKAPVDGLNPYFQPFYKPNERGKALCMRPDVMELDEAEEFPSYYKDQTLYLAIRNLIIALWTLNPCQLLTESKCCRFLLLRGLTRVRLCTMEVPQILQFATRKGLVNHGAIRRPISKPSTAANGNERVGLLPGACSEQKVLVIGAGPAGLAAARQLHNFGCDVTCLEARDRIGGRVHDDWSLEGVCVGKGAQIINGCVNNPLALVSHQLGLKMHTLQSRCDLFDGSADAKSKGRSPTKAVPFHCDKRMDFHFNALLDIIVEWRQAQAEDAIDCSLGEKIEEAHQEWMKQSGLSFNELEERLLSFHVGNLEFACGACLNKVSAFHWDQNEIFSQFSGDHTFMQFGFSTLLTAIAQDIDIRYKSPVSDVIIDGDRVRVKIANDEKEFVADRVLITVPLAVLRSGSIRFEPALPVSKQEAMNRLGCGCIEKIAMLFPNRFWGKKIAGANYFGYVPSTPNKKGFFSVFYDVPYPQCEKSSVLMSVISGKAVEVARTLTDEEILKIAMNILRDIFPEELVPEPKKYFVTRWRDDPYSQMAYSYVKCGSSGNDYDEVAKEVQDRIYFAGEGTNRHFPQTVTGAYLSGIREASKIVSCKKTK